MYTLRTGAPSRHKSTPISALKWARDVLVECHDGFFRTIRVIVVIAGVSRKERCLSTGMLPCQLGTRHRHVICVHGV